MIIDTFDSKIHSEEVFSVSESEHDAVMQMMAAESDGFEGYGEWSAALEQNAESEDFIVRDGKVSHKPEPRSIGRVNGYEL